MGDAIAFFENLLDVDTWKRVGYVVAGGILIIVALSRFAVSERAFVMGGRLLK